MEELPEYNGFKKSYLYKLVHSNALNFETTFATIALISSPQRQEFFIF